jgi:hypothetical protein
MNTIEILDAGRAGSGGYKVDVGRGQRIRRVSSEWFNRPADERYLSLSELMASVQSRAERSRTRTVESAAIRVEASRDDAERLTLMIPGSDAPVAPTHWSFVPPRQHRRRAGRLSEAYSTLFRIHRFLSKHKPCAHSHAIPRPY